MTKSKALEATEIPLYLLPKTIARQINLFGDAVYRISVKRTHWHHYNVSVRTKTIRKELSIVPVAAIEGVRHLVKSRGTRRKCIS